MQIENIAFPKVSIKEAQRLQRLRSFDILDSGPESTYDRITLIACEVFGDSEAYLCFVDESRTYFKSKTGNSTICDYMNDSPYWKNILLSEQSTLIEDLTGVAEPLPDIFTKQFKSFAASPLKTDEGYILGSLIVFGKNPFQHENTKFKILSELAQLLMDQLTIRLITKKAFSINAEIMIQTIHDFKNPLSSIQLGAEILASVSSEESVRKDFSGLIVRNVKKILEKLNNLLIFYKLDEKVQTERSSIDFIELLKSVVNSLSEISRKKYQTVHLSAPDSAFISGESSQLESIFENLIGNAIKFSPISTQISISVLVQSNKVLTIIEDQGPGLSSADYAKLFVRYAKLSATPTASESSHGLGLSIVKTLVELHRGAVWAESDGKNKGSRFYVSLPLL